jgi:hypothetical protein
VPLLPQLVRDGAQAFLAVLGMFAFSFQSPLHRLADVSRTRRSSPSPSAPMSEPALKSMFYSWDNDGICARRRLSIDTVRQRQQW